MVQDAKEPLLNIDPHAAITKPSLEVACFGPFELMLLGATLCTVVNSMIGYLKVPLPALIQGRYFLQCKKHKLGGSFHSLLRLTIEVMMSATIAAVILSACAMQQVSGTFLSRAASKDDGSCAQCIQAVNTFLGSDCKEPRCLVQALSAKQDKLDYKEAMKVHGDFMVCAKQNQCNLEAGHAAAQEFDMDFDFTDPAFFLQVDAESTEAETDDEGSDSEEEADDSDDEPQPQACAQCLQGVNTFLGSDCKELRCIVQELAAKQDQLDQKQATAVYGDFKSCAKQNKCNVDAGTAAAEEFNFNFDELVSVLQVDDESTEAESADADSEEDADDSNDESEE